MSSDESHEGDTAPLPPGSSSTSAASETLLDVESRLNRLQMQLSAVHSRLYEVQELRHTKSAHAASEEAAPLVPLDDAVAALNALFVDISSALTPLAVDVGAFNAQDASARHLRYNLAELQDQWADIQRDVEEVKEELKEDRWLGQFRMAAQQASDMMSSLEKAMVPIQDLVNHVKLLQQAYGGIETWRDPASVPDVSVPTFEKTLKSYEARAESYLPSINQVLSNLDKGARERVTRNGEALRTHADLISRWHNLTDCLDCLRVDATSAHLWLLAGSSPVAQQRLPHIPKSIPNELSSFGGPSLSSHTDDLSSEGSRQTSLSSRLMTPPVEETSKSRRSSVASSLSRSMSPFNRMIGRMGNVSLKSNRKRSPAGSSSTGSPSPYNSMRLSEPGIRASPSASRRLDRLAAQTASPTPPKPRWNASTTKLEELSKASPAPKVIQRRTSSNALNQSASSPARPSTRLLPPSASQSFYPPRISTPTPPERPPSRSFARPPTPSMIPRPQSRITESPSASNLMTRSASRSDLTPSRLPRPSSRNNNLGVEHPHTYPRPSSSISNFSSYGPAAPPISPSRPPYRMPKSSSMSLLPGEDPSQSLLQLPPFALDTRPRTPPSPFFRGQTLSPEPLPSRPSLPGSSSRALMTPSSSTLSLTPPSSFRGAPGAGVPRSSSRMSLGRSGATTPSSAFFPPAGAPRTFAPPTPYKPHRFNLLDLEIARIVNATPNAMSVERVDPLPRGAAAAAADLNTASYRFTSPRGEEKVYNCKALELHRGRASSGLQGDGKVVKVMARVGGGWLDLETHLLKLFAF